MPPVGKNLGSMIKDVARNPPPGLLKFLDRMEICTFGFKWMSVGYVFYGGYEISELRSVMKELDRSMDKKLENLEKIYAKR